MIWRSMTIPWGNKRYVGYTDNKSRLERTKKEDTFSRVASGRKMGYAYEITGTTGAIRFDQEDQNAVWLYKAEGPQAERGFRKILTGPLHPDYLPFCQGPGHGTGYQDQITIEARDFLRAIETGRPVWPQFRDGLAVMQVVEAAHQSHKSKAWVEVSR